MKENQRTDSKISNCCGNRKWTYSLWSCHTFLRIFLFWALILTLILTIFMEHSSARTSMIIRRWTIIPKQIIAPPHECRLSLTETIPIGVMYPSNVTHTPIKNVWLDFIENAKESIEIVSYYWRLRLNDEYNDESTIEGEKFFLTLAKTVVEKKIKLRVIHNVPVPDVTTTDTDYFANISNAEVRKVNFTKLFGGGILHSKFWIVDRKHFYIGTSNISWRSMAHIQELGVVAHDCPVLAKDLAKIFDLYWSLGATNAVMPKSWPDNLTTDINMENPVQISDRQRAYSVFISSSPPQLNAKGRTKDDDAIVSVMEKAERFIYISITNYSPMTEHRIPKEFWPKIDMAIRTAALQRKVQVKMLLSVSDSTKRSEIYFLRSLTALTDAYPGVDIQVKFFKVPSTPEQARIPHARFHHHKYMVTEKSIYVGTSNWSADYFLSLTGNAIVIQDGDSNSTMTSVREDLLNVFRRDWTSSYATDMEKLNVSQIFKRS